ncbi:MAG: hypothetical protein IRA32_11015, partial [Xanthomonas citri pv. citri]
VVAIVDACLPARWNNWNGRNMEWRSLDRPVWPACSPLPWAWTARGTEGSRNAPATSVLNRAASGTAMAVALVSPV